MAYDFTKDVAEIIEDFEKGDKGALVRVSRIVNTESGEEFIDIRNMYTSDGEIKYTAKGIRMSKEMAMGVLKAAIKGLGEDGVGLLKEIGGL